MVGEQVQAYWNGEQFSEKEEYGIDFKIGLTPSGSDETGPSVAVSCTSNGFFAVLALLPNTNRLQALTLDDNPSPGVYTFKSTRDCDDFQLRLEFTEEPFPKPVMQTYDPETDLREAQVGDGITVHLRKDQTTTPGRTQVEGIILQVADSSGSISKSGHTMSDYPEGPVMSFLIDVDSQQITDGRDADHSLLMSPCLSNPGDSQGRLDVVGTSDPLEVHWTSKHDTAKLLVDAVTISPANGEPWTVTNRTLPEIQFTPLCDLSLDERRDTLRTGFAQRPDLSISDAALELFASAVTDPGISAQVTVRYESPKSDQVLSKQGSLEAVESVYYAESNRAKHQIKFVDENLHYLLIDSADDSTAPVGLYSKANNRHFDTDLGKVQGIDVS